MIALYTLVFSRRACALSFAHCELFIECGKQSIFSVSLDVQEIHVCTLGTCRNDNLSCLQLILYAVQYAQECSRSNLVYTLANEKKTKQALKTIYSIFFERPISSSCEFNALRTLGRRERKMRWYGIFKKLCNLLMLSSII